MFERKLHQAETELLRAQQEDPKLATVYVRLAMLYASLQRFDDAIAALAEGYSADPLWLALPATEVCIRYFRREYDCAIACAKRALELHPYLQLGRIYYAEALEAVGHTGEALRHYRLACVLCPDVPWLQALEGASLARNGHVAQAAAILAELELAGQTQYVDAYYLALLLDALGMRDQAFLTLDRAVAENSTVLPILEVDPKMDSLRQDPRFGRLRARVFEPHTSAIAV
jgi:tetratricopeptide (TPR) repeat protein